MEKSNKIRIVFLCSGGGGNLRFINQASENGWLSNAAIVAVLTDRECAANEYARLHGLVEKHIDFTHGQQKLIECLEYYNADIIVTTVHRILNSEVIKRFRGKLINLHYSILPAFGGVIGTNAVKEAIAYGALFTGVTIHAVDENLDAGKPLTQVAIPLRSFDTINSIMDILFRCGCISLGSVINSFIYNDSDTNEEACKIKNRLCLFSKKINIALDVNDEKFWENIKQWI